MYLFTMFKGKKDKDFFLAFKVFHISIIKVDACF